MTMLRTIAFVFALAAAGAVRAQGTFIAQHLGSRDPLTEGFTLATLSGDAAWGPGTNDAGTAAWQLGFGQGGTYLDAFPRPFTGASWTLSVLARVVDDTSGRSVFAVNVGSGAVDYSILFGSDSNGAFVVELGSSSTTPVLVFPGTGSAYHRLELSFDAAAGSGTLLVDGITELAGIVPYQFPASQPAIAFGGGSQIAGNYQANWAEVTLQMVPEPSLTALLLLGGAGGLVLSCRREGVRGNWRTGNQRWARAQHGK